MSTHTPGPWQAIYDRPWENDPLDLGGYRIDASDRVEQLAYVWNRTKRMNTGEPFGTESAASDASLIAAAPDLLEALELIVARTPYDGQGYMGLDAWNAARAAIAKARGEKT